MIHLSYYKHGVEFAVLAWYASTFTSLPPRTIGMSKIRDITRNKVRAMMASELD